MQAELSASSVPVPRETTILALLRRHHLADAFSIALPASANHDPEVLARFLFRSQGRWVNALMRVRDTIMSTFGVKTAKEMENAPAGDVGGRVGFFRIYAKRDNEIVLGEDDRHLDFRLSVMVRQADAATGRSEVVLSTVVCCHNALGHAYIAVIRPLHKLIVRSTLNRAAKAGWPREAVETA
ncbi:MAG TPA: DUF2867 domain-containing protein [Noviherbaspirillum sp.]|nr:DUF2867 domain-containing protein [Noviherbaspirillum sp.]